MKKSAILFLFVITSVCAFAQTKVVKSDTVLIEAIVPATLEKNSAERVKKINELQAKFTELQDKYKDLLRQNKDDFSILIEFNKIDTTKFYRDKNGNPLLMVKPGKVIFKSKP